TLADEQFQPLGESITAQCGGELKIAALRENEPGDPFPELTTRLGGWRVTYKDPYSTQEEVLTYPASEFMIAVDLDRHPDWGIRITFEMYDVQALSDSGATTITAFDRRDTEAPVLAAVPDLMLAGCASSTAQAVPVPTSVNDNCSTPFVQGRVT